MSKNPNIHIYLTYLSVEMIYNSERMDTRSIECFQKKKHQHQTSVYFLLFTFYFYFYFLLRSSGMMGWDGLEKEEESSACMMMISQHGMAWHDLGLSVNSTPVAIAIPAR